MGAASATPSGGLAEERANSRSQPFNELASLAGKSGVVRVALLIDAVARCCCVSLQEGQHRLERLRSVARSHRSRRNNFSCIGFTSYRNAVQPQSVRTQRGSANPDKMLHRQCAPEAGLRPNASWNRQPWHGDQIAAVEIILHERTAVGFVLADKHQSCAVELHIVEEPGAHRGQIGNGLDVMVTPTSEQSHPPATALPAKEEYPAGLDQDSESSLLATTLLLTNGLRCSRVRPVSF